MPALYHDFTTSSEIIAWNIEQRVGGFRGVTRGLDVKLVQYLLFFHARGRKKSGKGVITISGVDGVWGPNSKAALDRYEVENKAILINDDACDPATPGRVAGLFSHSRKLKILALQGEYVKLKAGNDDLNSITGEDIQATLMALPENEGDLPADLRSKMQQIRDTELMS